MQIGSIVSCKNLVFHDSISDKKRNRPCVVLCNIDDENVCICPITTALKALNRYPDMHYFIPEAIYDYKKISIAELNNLLIYNINDLVDKHIILSENTMSQLFDKILKFYEENEINEDVIKIIKKNNQEKSFRKIKA